MPRFFRGLLIVPLALSAASFRLPTTAHSVGRRVSMISVSKGESFACAVTAPGAVVFCWGSVEGGVLGKAVSNRRSPAPVALRGIGSRDSIVAVSAGATPFACALSASGAAQCWGANDYGEIGDGAAGNVRSPTRVRTSEPLASISAGENMACGLARDGRAFCWGLNDNGQLGVGDSAVHRLPVPVKTRFRFRQLSVGAAGGTCGVLQDARLLCWGRNDGGQLGTANQESVLTPRVSSMVAAERFSEVSVGNGITCGLTTDARVLCWGSPGKYLGSNAPDMVSVVELAVPQEERVVSVATGVQTSCLLTQSHHTYCWGSNEYGVLGRRGAASTDVALGRITSDADYGALSVGAFGCAVTVDGALDCWGAQRRGRARRTPFGADGRRVERISFE